MIGAQLRRQAALSRRMTRRRVVGALAASIGAVGLAQQPEDAAASRGPRIAHAAMKRRGKGYSYLGTGPQRYGCSGLVYVAVKEATGQDLTVDLVTQWHTGRHIRRKGIRKGDLVFFKGTQGKMKGPTHVGIAISPTRMVHAANRKEGVTVDKIATYNRYYLGARRV
jgi:cell wall-associated NlpC family hydrolase